MRKFISRLLVAGTLTVPLLSSAFVLGPTTPGKWGAAAMGTGATVTYSFMVTGDFLQRRVCGMHDLSPQQLHAFGLGGSDRLRICGLVFGGQHHVHGSR